MGDVRGGDWDFSYWTAADVRVWKSCSSAGVNVISGVGVLLVVVLVVVMLGELVFERGRHGLVFAVVVPIEVVPPVTVGVLT